MNSVDSVALINIISIGNTLCCLCVIVVNDIARLCWTTRDYSFEDVQLNFLC